MIGNCVRVSDARVSDALPKNSRPGCRPYHQASSSQPPGVVVILTPMNRYLLWMLPGKK